MSDSAASKPKHWAVLVGVNFNPYKEHGILSNKEHLGGAVRDVREMEQYLNNAPYPVNIAVLAATTPTDPSSTVPCESPDIWPTVQNFSNKLKTVLKEAKSGDFVYIHFSGHGTTKPRTGNKDFAKSTKHAENVAIVLYDNRNTLRSYIHGEQLATVLERMVKEGLQVNVVLDCCFSGSVLRTTSATGNAVRAVDYRQSADLDAADHTDSWSNVFDLDSDYREARLGPHQWFVNPKGYSLLAACGPHTTAGEMELETGERRGALSYFLLRALEDLRKRNINITHETLYGNLYVRFSAARPSQTPTRFGNRALSFFGSLELRCSLENLIPLFWRDQCLYLDEGAAQGVSVGNVYQAYPLGVEEGTGIKVRVSKVHGLQSELEAVGEPLTALNHIQTGWNAKPLSFAERKIPIRLSPLVYSRLRKEAKFDHTHFIRWCVDGKSKEACLFDVQLDEAQKYRIYNDMKEQLICIPSIHIDEDKAERSMLYIIQRLAAYKYFEGIENGGTKAPLEDLVSLTPSINNIEASASKQFDVKQGDTWSLTVKNLSDKPIYLALFDFTMSWKVLDLTSPEGDNSFEEVLPHNQKGDPKSSIELEMEIPDYIRALGRSRCKDVMKIFLTSRPTLFPSMNLDRDLDDARRGGEDDGTGGIIDFLDHLAPELRGDTIAEKEHWFTSNYVIWTTLDDGS